ncbi:hypothetical protein [Pandoraea sp. NPDC087047]|uniref:hypothetical protein n=1 Tax=Pandoraea sp. NPDC087047 TaxID=3364390 RepID=UPI00381511AC
MHHFCTLFDSNYLVKGIAMLESLRAHCPDAQVSVLCMDDETNAILTEMALPGVSCIPLDTLEDDDLRRVKAQRSRAEYCWTLSPCLPSYILDKHPEIDCITYLDADLMFYSSVAPVFEEIGSASVAIIEHRFPDVWKHLEINGRYCVEWVSFRRDTQGMACLARWREQCIEWCFHRLEDNRMGDQKYLDEWPQRYDSLCVIQTKGAGVAPWNYSRYRFTQAADGTPLVDGEPLVFYHFHQFQWLSNGEFDRLSGYYRSLGQEPEAVYARYEHVLTQTLARVRRLRPGFRAGMKPVLRVKSQRLVQTLLPGPLKQLFKKVIKAV